MMRALMTKTLFVFSILLSAQALAFDVDGLSYNVINTTDVEVTGRAAGNTATGIVIPETVVDSGITYSVTSVGDSAFFINALTSVTIPDSVTIIGPYAFQGNALTSVTIPDSVTIIGTQAFFSNALTSVTIPDSVKTIGDSAFYNNALTSVIIGNSVTSIGDIAFVNNALTSVIIPDSVTTIGSSAFRSNALTSVIIGNSVTTIGEYAFWQNALTSVTIPDSVTIIGRYAFNTNALTSVIIGNSVTSIGDSAFYINALTSVTIPDSVTSIGSAAFSLNSLTSAAFLGNFGTFNLNMFLRNPNLMTITYVQGAAGWPQTFTSGTGSVTATAVPIDPIDPVDPGGDSVFNLSLGEPINGEVHSGIGNLRGWAISNNGIDRVEIFIDGKYMYDAPYGGLRVDVEAAFPNVGGSLLSGYSLAFGYADLGSGQHTVRAVAYDLLGNSTEQSSTFNVVVYDKNFINSNEVVDLLGSTLSASGDEIMINGASIGQRSYNLKLKWRTAEQGFEVIEIQ